MSGRRANQTRAAKKRRYLALRTEQGVSQAEAIRLLNVGRTTAWAWDREAGIANEPKDEPKGTPPGDKPTPEIASSQFREHLERLEKAQVVPQGTAALLDREPEQDPNVPGLKIVDGVPIDEHQTPLGMVMGVGASIRGTFGTLVGPDDPFPAPTSTDKPGSAVRVHVRRELPSDVHRFARMASHR